MSSDQLPRAQRRAKKAHQDATLHPDATNNLDETANIDEENKAVVDVAPVEYADVIVYLRGGEKACWVWADTDEAALALFAEYAQAEGTPAEADGPVPGDRVLRALVDGDVRRVLLSPFQDIVRTKRA